MKCAKGRPGLVLLASFDKIMKMPETTEMQLASVVLSGWHWDVSRQPVE